MVNYKVKGLYKDREVSVVVPVHNEEKTLDQCLTSIRKQRSVGEIVVVLDRCEDNSEKIARKHAEQDPRVKILHFNKHVFKTNYCAETANFGILKAKNDIVCTVDADTVLGKDYISSLLPYLKRPTASVSGRLFPRHKRLLQFFETIGGTGRIFLRPIWNEAGGLQDIMSCDTLFDLNLLKKHYDFKVVETAVMYDVRDYSMTQLIRQAIRRGRGRRHIGQSFSFMLGHSLYCLTKTPFGFIELLANITGYLTTRRRTSRRDMKLYETRRMREIVKKLMR